MDCCFFFCKTTNHFRKGKKPQFICNIIQKFYLNKFIWALQELTHTLREHLKSCQIKWISIQSFAEFFHIAFFWIKVKWCEFLEHLNVPVFDRKYNLLLLFDGEKATIMYNPFKFHHFIMHQQWIHVASAVYLKFLGHISL